MHLHKKLITLFGLALAAAPFTHAADGTYLRASAVQVIPAMSGADDSIGAFVAYGANFDNRDGNSANQFEMEVGYAKWDYAASSVISGVTYTGDADLRFAPLLLTYRYQWNFCERFGLAVGPSVGMSYVHGSGLVTDGVTTEGFSDDDWVFSYGAGAQLDIKLTDNTALVLGYRYLFNQDASFAIAGTEIKVTDLDTQLIEVGFRIGWPY